MYEAILSEDGKYNIPDSFTSRTVEILQTYLKSLGIRMETVYDEDEFIGEPEHSEEMIGVEIGTAIIFCTVEESYYLKKLQKVYHRYLKEHSEESIDLDMADVWDYILDHLPFKKKHLTDNIIDLFLTHISDFGILTKEI